MLVAVRQLIPIEIGPAPHFDEKVSTFTELEIKGPLRLQQTLPKRCGLTVIASQSRTYFIHQTMTDFLLSKNGFERPIGKV